MRRSICVLVPALAALSLALGCQGAPTGSPLDEGRVAVDPGGKTVRAKLAGKLLTIRSRDGKRLDGLKVLVRGKVYEAKDGKLDLPASVLAEAKAAGELLLLVPGHLPQRVGLDQAGEVVLQPLGRTEVHRGVTPVGGTIAGPGGGVTLTLPPGLIRNPATDVAVSDFVPPPRAPGEPPAPGEIDPKAEREDLLTKVGAPPAARGCDQPMPCEVQGGIGMVYSFDGPIAAGTIEQALDLDVYAASATPEFATAARRIRETFAAIDRTGEPRWRQVLAADFGLRLEGATLHYRVKVGDDAVRDKVATIEVDGVSLLGTRIVVMVKSAIQAGAGGSEFDGPGAEDGGTSTAGTGGGTTSGGSPGAGGLGELGRPRTLSVAAGWVITTGGAPVPRGLPSLISDDGSTLISDDGSTLISDDGSTLISDDGSTLISDDGSTLISDDGSTLISDDGSTLVSDNRAGMLGGELRVPFVAGEAPKYRLQAYQDYPYAGAKVRAIDGLGLPYTRFVAADASSRYQLPFATTPFSLNGMFLQVVAGNYRLYTLTLAPGKAAYDEKVDAATTAVACLLLDEINRNPLGILAIRKELFDDDVAYFRQEMDQADAGYVVSHHVPAVARHVRAWLAGKPRKVLRCIPSVGPAAGTGAGTMADGAALTAASFRAPQAVVRGGDGAYYVCDEDFAAGSLRPTIRRYDPAAGMVSTVAGDQGGTAIGQDGPAAAAVFSNLRGIVLDDAGGVLVQDDWARATTRIRRVAGGQVATLTGPGPALTFAVEPPEPDLPAIEEGFGFQRDAAGNLYYVERLGHRVMKLVPDGAGGYTSSVVAGVRGQPGNANGSQATARLDSPRDLAVLPDGSAIFVAEWAKEPPITGRFLHRIRRIEPAAAGTARFMTTWAGPDVPASGQADGWGPAARFGLPMRLALGPDGSLYVAENDRLAIRKVSPSRMVTTVLGGGTASAAEYGQAVSLKPALKPDGTQRDYPIGGMAIEPGAGSGPSRLLYTDRYAGRLKVLEPLP